jgi:hypothetical protein
MSQAKPGPSMNPGLEAELQLRLQGLQHDVAKSATMVRRLAVLAISLVLLLLLLLVALHLYHVMQYAEVSNVEAVTAEDRSGGAEILYTPKSAGKIEFVRESDGLVQTLTEYANDPGSPDKSDGKFNWSGKENEKTRFQVTYREGLFLVTKDLTVTPRKSK